MNDDEIAELMRQADPARDVRDKRSEAELISDLRAITHPAIPVSRRLRTPRRTPASKRTRWLAISTSAAVVVAAAVLAPLVLPFGGVPSVAATPPLLLLSPTTQTLEDVVDRATARLHAGPGGAAERHASFEGWYLQTEVDSESTRSVISPQRQEIVWNDDASGTITITAGDAYTVTDGSTQPATDDSAPPAGTILSQQEFPAAEMPVLFLTPPPETASELRDYLAEVIGLAPDADAAAYLSAIRVLLSEWTLSPAQQAALLEILATSDGLSVAGDVVDRLGRPGTALRASSSSTPQFEQLAIVGHDTGALVALETIYLGGQPELDAPAPSVIEYIAWK